MTIPKAQTVDTKYTLRERIKRAVPAAAIAGVAFGFGSILNCGAILHPDNILQYERGIIEKNGMNPAALINIRDNLTTPVTFTTPPKRSGNNNYQVKGAVSQDRTQLVVTESFQNSVYLHAGTVVVNTYTGNVLSAQYCSTTLLQSGYEDGNGYQDVVLHHNSKYFQIQKPLLLLQQLVLHA